MMDFPIHIDTISMGLPILYFKESQVKNLNFNIYLSLKVFFIFANSADPDEMQHHAAFHLSLHCLPEYPFKGYQYTRGYVCLLGNFACFFVVC